MLLMHAHGYTRSRFVHLTQSNLIAARSVMRECKRDFVILFSDTDGPWRVEKMHIWMIMQGCSIRFSVRACQANIPAEQHKGWIACQANIPAEQHTGWIDRYLNLFCQIGYSVLGAPVSHGLKWCGHRFQHSESQMKVDWGSSFSSPTQNENCSAWSLLRRILCCRTRIQCPAEKTKEMTTDRRRIRWRSIWVGRAVWCGGRLLLTVAASPWIRVSGYWGGGRAGRIRGWGAAATGGATDRTVRGGGGSGGRRRWWQRWQFNAIVKEKCDMKLTLFF
jgi:hypothetical protein